MWINDIWDICKRYWGKGSQRFQEAHNDAAIPRNLSRRDGRKARPYAT